MDRKRKCYTYLRVSTEKQVDGYSIDAQRKNVKNPATGKSSPRMRDQSEWYRSEGLHEPIISRELFDKAQEIRKKNTHNQPKVYNPDHAAVFSGLLVCPVCGAPMKNYS